MPAAPARAADRNLLMAAAAPLLALMSSVRSGRATIELPGLHGMAVDAITMFRDAIRGSYPEEIQRRAKYALGATADDVALNLPGNENDATNGRADPWWCASSTRISAAIASGPCWTR